MQKGKSTSSTQEHTEQFPIVGIGASAGGLDAFKRFLKAVPEKSGMAFVVVQHLDPTHESILPEILSRFTKIPVLEITDEIKLEPDHVYVIPSNKTLTSTDGILKITPRSKINPHLAIDIFFKSLAEVHLNYAVGIVLSGTGSDGTLGLKEIKANGGVTFAQDDQSSTYDGMPKSAIAADVVDFILAPEKIPEQLLLINRVYKTHYLDPDVHLTSKEENIFKQILAILRLRNGVDFTYYKQNTIRRRLARRMAITKKELLSDYLILLQADKDEQSALFQDILIPVTSYFRDPKIWKTVSETIFPALLKNSASTDPIRIWSAACSTGEEVYSLAICLQEFLNKEGITRQIQIFGTDISEIAIAKARAGIYSKAETANVSESRLKSYFIKNNAGYQVNRLIRDMCVFAVHNFLKDPPFAKIDLISCRNVMIYLDPFLQKHALSTFHYALKEHGFLLLGISETAVAASELFTPFLKPDKIYSRISVAGRYTPITSERKEKTKETIKTVAKTQTVQTDFRKNAETILLAKYTPANVIINEHMDIVHINGSISPFLEPSPGKPNFNLIKMARGSLGFELRNAVHKAKSTNTSFIKENIPLDNNEKSYTVSIEVIPLTDTIEPYFLILFHKILKQDTKQDKKNINSQEGNEEFYLRINQLERELAQAREDMLSITEEQETSNEELQSANEELLSGSEELQSLNEELETAKEEVQSTNEELIVVNQELIEKHEQLDRDRMYAEAIIQTLREPFVVLDKEFRIKKVADSFCKKFNITEREIHGRYFYEIANRQWDNPLLRSMLEKILPKKTKLEDFEIELNFPSTGDCTLLLNARQIINKKIDEELILLAIEDISTKKAEEEIKQKFAKELETKVKERTTALEQSNMQLEQFSHTASHEFQEPLRKIVTFSKYLQQWKDNSMPEEIKSYLNKIEAASIRMSKLIQDMLSFASVTNHQKLFEKTDLNAILKDILFDFELLISEKKVQITFDPLPTIEAVPFQMNQLFYDIIHNSIKFAKPDVPPVIHITAHKLSREEKKLHPKLNPKLIYYQICFKDNGIGFEQKYAAQIFIMFQRLNTISSHFGTGIGLALCKKIVQNYHGEIYAEGKLNVGAKIYVILPMQQPTD